MRVRCKCGKLGIIQSTNMITEEITQLYCTCSDPLCGHSFVMDLSFSHTLSPSALDIPKELLEKIQRATRPQQKKLFAELASHIP